jgi:peptidoglycan/xylan/chitin deacetylase (PgdA/CDA1 family)
MQQRGHEIGGHTLSHPYLTSLPEPERRREVSNDRRELSRLGLAVRSLAYPYGDVEAALEPAEGPSLPEIVAAAGYASARDTNGFSLARCGAGPETLPPANAYRLRSSAPSTTRRQPTTAARPHPPTRPRRCSLGWITPRAAAARGAERRGRALLPHRRGNRQRRSRRRRLARRARGLLDAKRRSSARCQPATPNACRPSTTGPSCWDGDQGSCQSRRSVANLGLRPKKCGTETGNTN